MKLYIKNMVCDRCIMAVRTILTHHEIIIEEIELGMVKLKQELEKSEIESVRTELEKIGFELIDDKWARIIEKIKAAIISLVHHGLSEHRQNLSDFIVKDLHYDYTYLSSLFSSMEDITIEKYFIKQKIERAKELLVYDQHSLSQIADLMGYSSVAHLSNQFKQVTGITPTKFKTLRGTRLPIDKL